MFSHFLSKIFGTPDSRFVKKYTPFVQKINELEKIYHSMDDTNLQNQTSIFKERLHQGCSLDSLLFEAFAVVRETSWRVLNMRHHDVQILGGIALHYNFICEMKTGEGKTLMSTLPAYLNTLERKSVHIITVNDYLAKRDSQWMGEIFKFLNLSVGYLDSNGDVSERCQTYQCDIVYGTNNEFAFDYLKNHMRYDTEHMIKRKFHYAIIDEVDSILIDEARTPLIISGPADNDNQIYSKINTLISKLHRSDYDLDEKNNTSMFTDEGVEHLEKLLKEAHLLQKEDSLFSIENISLLHVSNQALKAHHLFKKDVQYIIKDSTILIIDEFTGRTMEGRRFGEGLHQALEAKEKLPIHNENQTLASITFQNYFRLYPKLCGMTGTAKTEEVEFYEIYKLNIVTIPTNKTFIRKDWPDRIYFTLEAKYNKIIELIQECHQKRQPVLVGTTSIEKSEYLSTLLKQKTGLEAQVLNARFHEQEADIIAKAGMPGTITIATNMAGRGTDIQLGGNANLLYHEQQKKTGNPPDQTTIETIQQQTLKNCQIAKEAGGLYIIGTERHESRRIDNQLRGRSGRQGDPGESTFFLSIEDDLLRIFGGDTLKSLANRMGIDKDDMIQNQWISRAIERAQHKIETQNFDIRKNLLKYDDVVNEQRKIIYEQRHEIIFSKNIHGTFEDILEDLIENFCHMHAPVNKSHLLWDKKMIHEEALRTFSMNIPVEDIITTEIHAQEFQVYLTTVTKKFIDQKMQRYSIDIWLDLEKRIFLHVLDKAWKNHLNLLDHLRSGVSLRAYAQRNPLEEYKKEAFEMFQNMLDHIRSEFILLLFQVEFRDQKEPSPIFQIPKNFTPKDAEQVDPLYQKVSRNTLCPCGSQKKYKHCHGKIVNL